ncbi:MAG: Clp protease N-terminal domain-containing protein, partial [Longimicrobiales bacterium]
MNYNFTDRVRKVLAMAREEAIRLSHDYVGTEHILLGLIREGEGVAAAVLMNLNVDLDQIHERIEEQVRKGKATIALGELPYTSRAKKVLEYAMAEARAQTLKILGSDINPSPPSGVGGGGGGGATPKSETKSKTPALDHFCR